jgi:hypothetical protein
MADTTEAPTSQSKNRRTAGGLWVRPRAQMKQAFTIVVVGIVYQMVLIGVLGYFSNKSFQIIAEVYHIEPDAVSVVTDSIFSNVVIVLALGIVLGVIAVFVWIRMNHRFFGPLVPIARHIDEMTQGNYATRLKLRKDDEWQDLADGLNKLAAKLEGKAT